MISILTFGRLPTLDEADWLAARREEGGTPSATALLSVELPRECADQGVGGPLVNQWAEAPPAAEMRVVILGEPSLWLGREWLQRLANRKVHSLERLVREEDGFRLVPHRPFAGSTPQTAVVLPGAVFPTSMGARQRIFQLLLALAEAGQPAVVVASEDRHFPHGPLLEQLSAHVAFHHGRRRLPTALRRMRRRTLGAALDRLFDGPESFADRLKKPPVAEAGAALARALCLFPLRTVIIEYAWMVGVVDALSQAQRKRVRFFCDTHDVNFVRDAGQRRWWQGRMAAERQKELELEVLRRFDVLLAISPADEQVLLQQPELPPVRLVPGGFDYAKLPVDVRAGESLTFGFIGRNMRANTAALDILLDEWWPALSAAFSGARLLIAGEVCRVKRIRHKCAELGHVELLGVVPELRDFYEQVDICCNPVVVQGGLNFKSIEAVMAGKLLLTNPLGLQCLGDARMALSCVDPVELVRTLTPLAGDRELLRATAGAAQTAAAERYSDAVAYQPLFDELAEGPTSGAVAEKEHRELADTCAVARPVQEPRVVLIQCGDHFENRQRILPLAQALQRKGRTPVVLVYDPSCVNFFLAEGVDCVALLHFDETLSERQERFAELSRTGRGGEFRGLSLDQVLELEVLRDPKKYAPEHRSRYEADVARHVDRLLRVLAHVSPDELFIWNGYTGLVANVLRVFAQRRGLAHGFLERSIFPDGVFLDPEGVNAASQLARLSLEELREFSQQLGPPARSREQVYPAPSDEAVRALRQDARFSNKRIAFLPLQVERDTNVLRSQVRTMAELVRQAQKEFPPDEWVLVVRPHPEEVDEVHIPRGDGVFLETTGELSAWIAAADVVVTLNSTVGLEALLRGARVRALGDSLFNKPGLCNLAEAPARGDVELFYQLLVGRYTCLPEAGPRWLGSEEDSSSRGALTSSAHFARVSPLDFAAWWQRERLLVHAAAVEAGELLVYRQLMRSATLQLTYRKLAEPVSDAWLTERSRRVFELPANVTIRILQGSAPRAQLSAHRAILVVDSPPPRTPGVVVDAFVTPWGVVASERSGAVASRRP